MEEVEQVEKKAEITIKGAIPDIVAFLRVFGSSRSLIEAEKKSGIHVRFED